MTKISIIVPVYNTEKYLRRCVDSILNQTLTDIELILVDDGSPDQSGRICDDYARLDQRIVVIHQPNAGQSEARNNGLKIAQGEYIAFVDSDDWIVPDMYQHLINLMTEHNCDVAEGLYQITDQEKPFIQNKEQIRVVQHDDIIRDYLYNGLIKRSAGYSVCNKVYEAHLLKNVEFGQICYGEDYLINFQIYQNTNRIVYSNKICYFYFQRQDSSVNSKLQKKDFDIVINCLKVQDLATKIKDQRIFKLAHIKVARCYFSLLAKSARFGNDQNITRDDIMDLQRKLRAEYFTLLLSPMPLNRKILMTGLVVKGLLSKK